MTLYVKSGSQFILLPPEQEAAVRSRVVPDGSSGPLLFVDSGYECVHSDPESDQIRAEWAEAAKRHRVPARVSALQMRLELDAMGILRDVEQLVASGDRETGMRWDRATVFERSYPAWNSLGERLGLSPRDIDNIFRSAKKRT